MLRLYSVRFGWMLVILGLWSVAAYAEQSQHRHAEQSQHRHDDHRDRHDNHRDRHDDHRDRHDEKFEYRYILLDKLVPDGFSFQPRSIDDRGRVYGNVDNDSYDTAKSSIAVYEDGVLTILQPGFADVANNKGTLGGGLYYEPPSFYSQAALFHGDQVEVVPFQPGEYYSRVVALNDRGTALVRSTDNSATYYSLYHKGQSIRLELDPDVNPEFMNNRGIIAGTLSGEDTLGFRFNPSKGELTLLNPVPPDPFSLVLGINSRGDVLGYSFINDAIERIGVWDRKGKFKTYFIEGIPEFPTLSFRLVFNDKNLIVITGVYGPDNERGNSYLVPKPGVRLNLADLVQNLPWHVQLDYIEDINSRGSMIGNSYDTGYFLLERVKSRGH